MAIQGGIMVSAVCLLLCSSRPCFADKPIIAFGNAAVAPSVMGLLNDVFQLSVIQVPLDAAEDENARELIASMLAAHLTILDKSTVDPVLVERLQHQGAKIDLVDFSKKRDPLVSFDDQLRAIHSVLVRYFPEHKRELSRSLNRELRKLRSRHGTHPVKMQQAGRALLKLAAG